MHGAEALPLCAERQLHSRRSGNNLPRLAEDGVPIIAPLPTTLQERCVAAPGLPAQILISKYADQLPLYRQQQIYQIRHSVYLPRQTMAHWMGLAADWPRPIYQQIRTGVMAGGYVQVDDTPIKYLALGYGRTKQGYFWTTRQPGGDVVFDGQTSRAESCLDKIIPVDFSGTLQCDAYQAYPTFAQSRDGSITLAGCWAHARRKFHEAKKQAPRQAGWIIHQIQYLYRKRPLWHLLTLLRTDSDPGGIHVVSRWDTTLMPPRVHRRASPILPRLRV